MFIFARFCKPRFESWLLTVKINGYNQLLFWRRWFLNVLWWAFVLDAQRKTCQILATWLQIFFLLFDSSRNFAMKVFSYWYKVSATWALVLLFIFSSFSEVFFQQFFTHFVQVNWANDIFIELHHIWIEVVIWSCGEWFFNQRLSVEDFLKLVQSFNNWIPFFFAHFKIGNKAFNNVEHFKSVHIFLAFSIEWHHLGVLSFDKQLLWWWYRASLSVCFDKFLLWIEKISRYTILWVYPFNFLCYKQLFWFLKCFSVNFVLLFKLFSWFRELIIFKILRRIKAQMLVQLTHINWYTVCNALAVGHIIANFQPVWKTKVDSLCNIKTKIEATMVCCSSRYHELVLLVLTFNDAYAHLIQHIWLHKSSLVTNEVLAYTVIIWKHALHKGLKFVIIFEVYPIPKLLLAVVKVVYAIKIHVFFVPPKHCTPRTNIHVRICDSRNLLVAKTLAIKENIKLMNLLTQELSSALKGSNQRLSQKDSQIHLIHIWEHYF